MDDEFPDYAELISQYEATEYDMLDALSKSDSGDAHRQFQRRRNAPGDSDSESESDHSTDNHSQTSYELDNTEVDGDGDDNNGNEQESKSGDSYSETSYEPDNTEADDGDNGSKTSSNTSHKNSDKLEDGGDDSDSYSSVSGDDGGGESDSYSSVGGDDGGDESDSYSSVSGEDGGDESDSYSSASEDGTFELDNTEVDNDGDRLDEQISSNTTNKNNDKIEDGEVTSFSSDSSYSSASKSNREKGIFASGIGKDIVDSASDRGSGKHSVESVGSVKSDEESNYESDSSYEEDLDDDERPRSDGDGVRSFSYETEDSYRDVEAANPNSLDKPTEIDASDSESERDKSATSRSINSLDDNNGVGFSNTNDWKDDSDYSLESHELRAESHFNKRGTSNHNFKHPSVDSGTLSDSTDGSGWQDAEDSSSLGSETNRAGESFEDEPLSNTESPKFRSSTHSDFDLDESDDDRSAENSQERFENEPQSNKGKFNDERRRKYSSFDDSSDGNNDSGSEYSDEDSEYSDKDSGNNDKSMDVISEDFRDETTRSESRKKSKSGRQISLSTVSSELEQRERLVSDRENTVNTRERKFTRWFIGISVLVLLGAVILIIVYFATPGKPADTLAPISASTAVPVAVPDPIVTAPPSKSPVQPQIIDETAKPTARPKPKPQPEPNPIPQNEVVIETSFLASVPNGKTEGVTAEALEDDLTDIFEIFVPQLLTEVLESDVMATRTRKYLRNLQESREEDVAVSNPIEVDVVEVGKCFLREVFNRIF